MSLKNTTLTAAICLSIGLFINLARFPYSHAAEYPSYLLSLAGTLLLYVPLTLFFVALYKKQ
jgi:hypothetical protein